MKRIHVIGRKNSGKTTLITELIQALTQLGYRVGTIKHTHHQHELDAPGKDSHRHREAGAAVVGILSRSMNAVFWQPEPTTVSDDRYEIFGSVFSNCQLTLVEGDTQTKATRIEVWRESLGSQPHAMTDPSITAVVSHDDCPGLPMPIWPRADVAALAEKILALVSPERAE